MLLPCPIDQLKSNSLERSHSTKQDAVALSSTEQSNVEIRQRTCQPTSWGYQMGYYIPISTVLDILRESMYSLFRHWGAQEDTLTNLRHHEDI